MEFRAQHRAPLETAGYTLLEVLVSMLVVSLLLGGLYTVLFQTQASFEHQQLAMSLRQEARVVLNELTVEVRMVGFDIGNLPEIRIGPEGRPGRR